jgi:hypothetical protein
MERKRYLELCQMNAVYPQSVIVECNGKDYYPRSLTVWFNSSGETKNTATMLDKNCRSEIHCNLSEVKE